MPPLGPTALSTSTYMKIRMKTFRMMERKMPLMSQIMEGMILTPPLVMRSDTY